MVARVEVLLVLATDLVPDAKGISLSLQVAGVTFVDGVKADTRHLGVLLPDQIGMHHREHGLKVSSIPGLIRGSHCLDVQHESVAVVLPGCGLAPGAWSGRLDLDRLS